MELKITARHFDLTDAIKEASRNRIIPMKRFFDKIIDAELVLMSEKHRQIAELTLHLPGGAIAAKSETKDLYESIDKVSEKVEKQLKKRKEKMKDHTGPDHMTREKILHEEEDDF
ncbi:MAG: ribosome hibernation-promoting factor, HPF/YfiA family [Candidatus Zixiibacteriota bacterium]